MLIPEKGYIGQATNLSCVPRLCGRAVTHLVYSAPTGLGGDPDPASVVALNLPTLSEPARQDPPSQTTEPLSAAPTTISLGNPGKEAAHEGAPFIMGEALPVVPERLVKKILRGEFVDMAELLKDNIEVERRRLASGDTLQGPRLGRREMPDFESWLQCFSAYAAVVTSKYPQKARELWAYQATMIAEHRKCGGRGWLLYDMAFRQQITSLEATDFSRINQSLYSTTFLAYGGRGQFCVRCMMSDHTQEECALNPSRALPVVHWRDPGAGPSRREDFEPRRRGSRGACFAFNDGRCTSPYCRFEHVCSRCGGNHRKSACRPRTRDNLPGKKEREPPTQAGGRL